MFSNLIESFTDPDQFAAAIQNADVDISLSAVGPFAASITAIGFESLVMQRLSDNLPHIVHARLRPDRSYITFHAEPGSSYFHNGTEIASGSLTRLAAEEPLFHRTIGGSSMAAMSLPLEEMRLAGISAADCDVSPPFGHDLTVNPRPAALAKLRRLHDSAVRLAHDSPEIITHPEAARGLEQVLTGVMVGCVTEGEVRDATLSQHHHRLIMKRFRRVLEQDPDRAWYVLEIAKAVGASVRSLTMCCHEYLGMGPKKYLVLRRLHLARRTLCAAEPHSLTVTDVATRCGFWQFGRFSVAYKALFGESPSITLNRPPA